MIVQMRMSHLNKLLCYLWLNILDFVLLLLIQLIQHPCHYKLEYQLHLLLLMHFHQMVYA